MPVKTATRQPSKGTKTDVRGESLSPRFLAFIVALLLLAGVVSMVEAQNKQAAWSMVALLLIGVLLVNAGQTLQSAAQIINRLKFK